MNNKALRGPVMGLFLFVVYLGIFYYKSLYNGCMKLILNVLAVIGWCIVIIFSLSPDFVVGLLV